KHP
ncbi:hypothetical protein MIMGU_mgv1a0228662mg, partial [Erythranthe guttata]